MKSTFCAALAILCLVFSGNSFAQEKETSDTGKFRNHDALTISNKGIKIEHTYPGEKDKDIAVKDSIRKEERKFSSSVALFDLGVTIMQDNTNYSDPSVVSYLNVPAGRQNKNLFDMRTAKSVNVNIYPFMEKFRALKTPGQRIFISTGLGLQLYNFRYENSLTYTKSPSGIILDTIAFKKDKLALDYLNVPLMFTFKTRIHKGRDGNKKNDEWLVYGAGITEGLRVGAWTKQVSDQRGKVKVHDLNGLADFNTCISAEFGVEGIFRIFATYQLTSLYQNGIDQHPLTIGLRFSGI